MNRDAMLCVGAWVRGCVGACVRARHAWPVVYSFALVAACICCECCKKQILIAS